MPENVDDRFMDVFHRWSDRKPSKLPDAQMDVLRQLVGGGTNPPGTRQCGKALLELKGSRSITLKRLEEMSMIERELPGALQRSGFADVVHVRWALTWKGFSYLKLRGEA